MTATHRRPSSLPVSQAGGRPHNDARIRMPAPSHFRITRRMRRSGHQMLDETDRPVRVHRLGSGRSRRCSRLPASKLAANTPDFGLCAGYEVAISIAHQVLFSSKECKKARAMNKPSAWVKLPFTARAPATPNSCGLTSSARKPPVASSSVMLTS
jgi:hypothetical protein